MKGIEGVKGFGENGARVGFGENATRVCFANWHISQVKETESSCLNNEGNKRFKYEKLGWAMP